MRSRPITRTLMTSRMRIAFIPSLSVFQFSVFTVVTHRFFCRPLRGGLRYSWEVTSPSAVINSQPSLSSPLPMLPLHRSVVAPHTLARLRRSSSTKMQAPHRDYAARDSLFAIAFAISFFVAPAANKARISRSIETAGSLASILATRDWLELRRFASSLWERPWLVRHFFKLSLKVSLSSTKAASSSDNPRNSRAEPTFHPDACNLLRFLAFMLFGV